MGFVPFTVLDNAVLETQYEIRGVRRADPGVKVVTAASASEVLEVLRSAAQAGVEKCIDFTRHPKLVHSDCLNIDLVGLYSIEAFENLHSTFQRHLRPYESSAVHKNSSTLWYGPLSAFSVKSAMAVSGAGAHLLNKDDLLVLIPPEGEFRIPISTPIGKLDPREIALNIVAGEYEGVELRHLARWQQFFISLSSVSLVAWLLYTYPILLTFVFSALIATLHWVIALILFDKSAVQIPVVAPLFSLVTVYLLGMSDRLDRREKREWDLEQEASNLQKLDEMRNNFLSLVSHDLKTPIARIQSVLERFLRGDFGGLSQTQIESLQRIVSASGHLQRTIATLLLLSRIESRDLRVQREPADLTQLIDEVVKLAQPSAQERKIDLRTELEPMFLIDIDQALIREVAANLLDNAMKYSPSGTTITIRCGELENCPDLSPPQPGAWFEIQDQGPGIPKEERKKVFEKFVRGRNENTAVDQAVKGTGLGLYLSSYFVEKHGGNMSLLSKTAGESLLEGSPSIQYFSQNHNDSGTVVRVSLPIDLPPDTPLPTE